MRPVSAATAFVASFLALTATAAAQGWVALGPVAQASAGAIEIDAAGPPNLYALHDTGVLRSQDGGLTWELGREGLSSDLNLVELLADPHRPGALYLAVHGVGIYRSTDGGEHWHPAGNRGLPHPIRPNDLEAHPSRPDTLFMTTAGDWIFVSEDRGDSWRPAGSEGNGSYDMRDLEFDPANPATLYAVGYWETLQGAGPLVYKSEDGGASWRELTLDVVLDSQPFLPAVAVPPGGAGAVYVASSGAGVVRSLDGGETWAFANDGLPSGDEGDVAVVALTAHPTDPSILYAGLDDRYLHPAGVFRTTDGGDHWEQVGEWPAGAPGPYDLALHADDPSLLFAAPGPWLAPAGEGEAWRSRHPHLPLSIRFVTLHPQDADTLFTGGFPPLLRQSHDAGETWEPFAAEPTPTPPGGFHELTLDPRDPDTRYLLGGKTIFKSVDGGLTWFESAEGIEDLTGVQGVAVDPTDSDLLYAWNGFALYRSTDGGASWERHFDPEGHLVAELALHPIDPARIYVGTFSLGGIEDSAEVCRSSDRGESWTCVPLGLPWQGVHDLAVDPGQPDRLYAAVEGTEGSSGVLRSLDGGETWTAASDGLPEVRILALAVDPRGAPSGGPGPVWAATNGRGVYRSTNGGESWLPVRGGMGPIRVSELEFAPGGLSLFAGTELGVYRLDESAGDPLPPDDVPWIEDESFPGFRFKVRIDQGGGRTIPGTREPACLPETVCVSGAVPGRSEVFLRIVGPKPNGWLWPTLVKFTTSRVEVWIQQLSTDRLRYYELRGASPGFDELPGLFDRFGFPPEP